MASGPIASWEIDGETVETESGPYLSPNVAVHPLRPATDRRHGGPLPRHLANQTRDHLSAHKALIFRGCPPKMLCGISSRFQLLSPTERQVSHALLTRSPLSTRRCPVRLACVRHAASVRPEPGSNSQKIVSKAPKCLKSSFSKFV